MPEGRNTPGLGATRLCAVFGTVFKFFTFASLLAAPFAAEVEEEVEEAEGGAITGASCAAQRGEQWVVRSRVWRERKAVSRAVVCSEEQEPDWARAGAGAEVGLGTQTRQDWVQRIKASCRVHMLWR